MEDIQISNKIIDLEGQGISNEIMLFNKLKNLEEIKSCEDLNLSNNKLTKVVPDMSFLAGLRHLDLENNPIEDFNLLIVNLKSLPSLESLKINLNKNEEFVMFSNSLPSLRILNGKLLKEEINLGKINIDLDHGDVDPSFFNEEQQRYNHLFTKINEKVKSQGRDAVTNFYNEYQKNLQVYFGEDNTKTLKNSASGNLLSFYSNKTTSKQQILMFYMEKLLELNEKKDKDLTILMKEVIQGLNEVNVARVEVIDKLLPKLENCEKNMNRKIDDIKRVNNASIEYDKLMKKYTNIKFILETYIDENKIIKHNYDFLEKENQVLTDKVIKLTKDLAENKGTGTAVGVLGQPDKFKSYYNIAKISSPKKNIKILTKKNMHDLIESIYESKTSYDKKCVEIRMPKETMEQHMYTFLNQKFGLKNLIIEWATSIINGIKMYANEEPDICLFGKILRNEIEEDYRVIFKKLKGSIYDLLIYFLKSKNPLKSKTEIKEIADKKVKKGVGVKEEEWKGIIYYLYETEDAKHLESKLVDFLRRKNFEKQNFDMNSYLAKTNKKQTREELNSPFKENLEIDYKNFLRILLDYQIKCRAKYLSNLNYLFHEIDKDSNGILNENEFIQLVANTDLFNEKFSEQSNRLLTLVDPANHKQVTFSEVVKVFSNEIIEERDSHGNKRKINLLSKISTKEYNYSQHESKTFEK